ncbi:hypothetical protein SSTU70S_04125 [Stutzerimonas stutzeri]
MRKLLLLSLALASPLALAEPECTSADKAQWQDQDKFQADLKAQGYEIKKFKVTDGNCYEEPTAGTRTSRRSKSISIR